VALVLGVTSAWGITRLLSHSRSGVEERLTSSLEAANQALHSWAETQQASVLTWAKHPELIELAWELVETPRNRDALNDNPAQEKLRKLLSPALQAHNYEGFFILDEDYISLASSRKENIGTKNLLVSQPKLLMKLWAGETIISTPQKSDVALATETGVLETNMPTMFVGAPIFDRMGLVFAALTFRINPAKDFTNILQQSRPGIHGETFAFNSSGMLITNSLFESSLRKVGLLKEKQSSILNIRLSDPGRDLLKSRNKEKELTQGGWPLTTMADRATKNTDGFIMEGYRSYLGKKVIGAWHWDKNLGFGMATEMDYKATYSGESDVVFVIITLFVLAVILIVAVLGIFHFAQNRLLQREKRFHHLIEGSLNGIAIFTGLKPRYQNKACALIFGYSGPREAQRRSFIKLLDPGDRAKLAQVILNLSGTEIKEVVRLECQGTRTDGRRIHLEIFFQVIYWNEKQSLMATIIDITQRVGLEMQLRQSQKLEAVGQLAGGVAHDFNNMLQIINGYSELVKEALGEDDPLRDSVNQILNAGNNAAALTRQLLAFSRKEVLRRKHVEVNQLVQSMSKMISRLIGEHIDYVVRTSSEVITVYAGEGSLEQLLLNLCVNARDAMPDGGRLELDVGLVEPDREFRKSRAWANEQKYACLSIKDNGKGMSPETLEHAFEPFYTTKDRGKGTGLGLSIVYGVAQQNGGQVEVSSTEGEGTEFKVYLPVSDKTMERRYGDDLVLEVGGNETILVAEDETDLRTLYKSLLERQGYRVLLAENGLEAVSLFKKHQAIVDLAILDVVMPKMNGKEVFKAIQEINPGLPVFFSTGYSTHLMDEEFLASNGLRVLMKPFTPASLLQTIREVLVEASIQRSSGESLSHRG